MLGEINAYHKVGFFASLNIYLQAILVHLVSSHPNRNECKRSG